MFFGEFDFGALSEQFAAAEEFLATVPPEQVKDAGVQLAEIGDVSLELAAMYTSTMIASGKPPAPSDALALTVAEFLRCAYYHPEWLAAIMARIDIRGQETTAVARFILERMPVAAVYDEDSMVPDNANV